MLESFSPGSDADWDAVLAATVAGKNSVLRVHGFSPNQHLFGREPNLPESLVEEHPNPVANSIIRNDPDSLREGRRASSGCSHCLAQEVR